MAKIIDLWVKDDVQDTGPGPGSLSPYIQQLLSVPPHPVSIKPQCDSAVIHKGWLKCG